MGARYRKDYAGEFVITEIRISNNAVRQEREWIPNSIVNDHISPRAVIIGSTNMSEYFDHRKLVNHRGGLHGSKRLQTYGTGNIWQDMPLEFYVSTDKKNIDQLIKSDYQESCVVMTNASNCLEHPEKLYLIPYMPMMDDLALAVYLAAFDGHTEIFLLGYNSETRGGSRTWMTDVNRIFQDYPEAQFWIVGTESCLPELWRENPNIDCIKPRKFISYCDI